MIAVATARPASWMEVEYVGPRAWDRDRRHGRRRAIPGDGMDASRPSVAGREAEPNDAGECGDRGP